MSAAPSQIPVEVAYATAEQQWLLALEVPPGATVADAIRLSGLLAHCPELDPLPATLGIFGRPAEPTTRLSPRDRVEIYRPLTADPKESRRSRVQAARARARSRPKRSPTAGS